MWEAHSQYPPPFQPPAERGGREAGTHPEKTQLPPGPQTSSKEGFLGAGSAAGSTFRLSWIQHFAPGGLRLCSLALPLPLWERGGPQGEAGPELLHSLVHTVTLCITDHGFGRIAW